MAKEQRPPTIRTFFRVAMVWGGAPQKGMSLVEGIGGTIVTDRIVCGPVGGREASALKRSTALTEAIEIGAFLNLPAEYNG